MRALTPRQCEIVTYIRQRIEHGPAPTLREIGDHFKIASLNGVRCHLRALKQKGRIDWQPGKARTLVLV